MKKVLLLCLAAMILFLSGCVPVLAASTPSEVTAKFLEEMSYTFRAGIILLIISFLFGLFTPRSADENFWWDDAPAALVLGMAGLFMFAICAFSKLGNIVLDAYVFGFWSFCVFFANFLACLAGKTIRRLAQRNLSEAEKEFKAELDFTEKAISQAKEETAQS